LLAGSGRAGVSDQQNSCASNLGAFILIASLVPGPGITQCVGAEGVIDIDIAAPTLSPWWQMRSDGCARPRSRSSSRSVLSPVAAIRGTVRRWAVWTTRTTHPTDLQPAEPSPPPHRLRQPGPIAGPLTPDVEYYMFQITINKRKSVGTGSCAAAPTLRPSC